MESGIWFYSTLYKSENQLITNAKVIIRLSINDINQIYSEHKSQKNILIF